MNSVGRFELTSLDGAHGKALTGISAAIQIVHE